MRFARFVCLCASLNVIGAATIERRDADFLSVARNSQEDMSGRSGDPPAKYFHESIFHPHYDGRFAERQLDYEEQKSALKRLVQTYLATFADLGIQTWLMHGSLLGWWWDKQILPWDSDIDVQVTEASMYYLAAYYNMSVFYYETPRQPNGRNYMLEINPHYTNREQSDKLNVIDARWIDTETGLFIDITTARYNLTHPAGEGMLSCKDGHEYRDTYIYPLRSTTFEGAQVHIPYMYKEMLLAEYGEKALVNTHFNNHVFDEQVMEWVPTPEEQTSQTPLRDHESDRTRVIANSEQTEKLWSKGRQPSSIAEATQRRKGQKPSNHRRPVKEPLR